MAIASVGTLGNAVDAVSASSFTWTTTTNALSTSGDLAILGITTDNLTTTDGATNDHTSVTGGTGTWTKLGEYTNGEGSAGAGVTQSLWLFQSTGTNAIGTVFTMNLSGSVVDKAAQGWKFTVAAGNSLQNGSAVQSNATDASNGYGSVAFSGLSSLSRLWIRGLGKEANTTTNITVSTSFTRFTSMVRSRNNAAAVCNHGEFRINTSTGETSNPTLAVSGDTAAVFAALEEYTPGGATHAATGALTGQGSTIAGTSAHIATHTSTGALSGQGAVIAGTAAHRALHTSTGALAGQGSALAGSATRTRQHASTGALTGAGASIVGSADHISGSSSHSATGTLTGQGAVLTGISVRYRLHAGSGALAGAGSSLAGVAAHRALHTSSGALIGQGSVVAGSAAKEGGAWIITPNPSPSPLTLTPALIADSFVLTPDTVPGSFPIS